MTGQKTESKEKPFILNLYKYSAPLIYEYVKLFACIASVAGQYPPLR